MFRLAEAQLINNSHSCMPAPPAAEITPFAASVACSRFGSDNGIFHRSLTAMALPCAASHLSNFLGEAKRATYAAAGDDASTATLLAGTKQLEYRSGDFFYRDIYAGMLMFAGQEIVYFREAPLWSMAYAGGTLPTVDMAEVRDTYAFLRRALSRVTGEHPFRGPRRFDEASFRYTNLIKGEIERFHGVERITSRGTLTYELRYSGGLLI